MFKLTLCLIAVVFVSGCLAAREDISEVFKKSTHQEDLKRMVDSIAKRQAKGQIKDIKVNSIEDITPAMYADIVKSNSRKNDLTLNYVAGRLKYIVVRPCEELVERTAQSTKKDETCKVGAPKVECVAHEVCKVVSKADKDGKMNLVKIAEQVKPLMAQK